MTRPTAGLRENLWHIIFGYETPGGRAFDVALLFTIVLSVLCVMLETVAPIREAWGRGLVVGEVFCTAMLPVAQFTSER